MKKKMDEAVIETMDVFEATVDLAAEKQDEIKRLKAKADEAQKTLQVAKKLLDCYLKPSEKYALEHEGEIFPDPTNEERETANSVYGLKQNGNPSVVLAEGLEDEDVIGKIERSKTLDERLKARFVLHTPKLSRQDIIAAYKADEIDDKTLKRLGLSVKKLKSLYVAQKAA